MGQIKIGPFQYTVRRTNAQDKDGFDNERWGDCRSDQLSIRIHEHAQGEMVKMILLHEALHAMEFIMGKDLGEEIIRPLAPLLLGILEENGVDLSPLMKCLDS